MRDPLRFRKLLCRAACADCVAAAACLCAGAEKITTVQEAADLIQSQLK